MRVWNLTVLEERQKTFVPRVAEVFAVQGRDDIRHYSAIDASTNSFANVNVCDYCAFGTKIIKRDAPLCSFVHVACRPCEREDKRQVIFRVW